MKAKEKVYMGEMDSKTVGEPKFRDPSELSIEQLTDPDYALKQLKLWGGRLTCSKCHHCREERDPRFRVC